MADITTNRDTIDRAAIGAKLQPPNHDQGSRLTCPMTGRRCEGDLSYLCEDYGCARKGGLSPHSHENF
jgi:hypothetical protein